MTTVCCNKQQIFLKDLMKRKFKQSWSTIQPISTKQTISSQIIENKIRPWHMAFDPGLGKIQNCDGVKLG